MSEEVEGKYRDRIRVDVESYIYPLIPKFLENRRLDIQTLREAVAREDFESARLLGHRMKGDGGSYGLNAVSEIGAALEKAAKSCDAQEVRAAVDRLEEFIERVEVHQAEE